MTVQRSVWIDCDGAYEGQPCDSQSNGHLGTATVTAAREEARADGWHRTRDGRDLCPDCWEVGQR